MVGDEFREKQAKKFLKEWCKVENTALCDNIAVLSRVIYLLRVQRLVVGCVFVYVCLLGESKNRGGGTSQWQ